MQYGDLASTPDCEKDSLLGLTAPMQNLFQIFEITVLIGRTIFSISLSLSIVSMIY